MAAPHTSEDSEQEVPLRGVLGEFRTALREEIEAARRAASSSAVALVNGRRIGQGALGHQYLFAIESALNVPDGSPGDLLITDHPPLEATVISIDGLAITLSLSADLRDFIARARFQSSARRPSSSDAETWPWIYLHLRSGTSSRPVAVCGSCPGSVFAVIRLAKPDRSVRLVHRLYPVNL